MKQVKLHIIFLLLTGYAIGQKLETLLDKQTMQIGEPFSLTYSIISPVSLHTSIYDIRVGTMPAKSSGGSLDAVLNVPYELEVLALFEDTSYTEGNQFIWKGTYTLTGWDSAYVIIPPERILLGDSTFYFPAAMIQITSPVADPTKDIYDINEEFTEVEGESTLLTFLLKQGWWIFLVLCGASYFVWKKYRRKSKGNQEKEISLRDRIIQEINALESGKSYESDLKEYYFQLSVIVRKFLSEHYQLRLMECTTSEVRGVLMQHKIASDTIDVIVKLLNQSDMVKFAQSQPPTEELFRITNEARQIVDEVATLNLSNVE